MLPALPWGERRVRTPTGRAPPMAPGPPGRARHTSPQLLAEEDPLHTETGRQRLSHACPSTSGPPTLPQPQTQELFGDGWGAARGPHPPHPPLTGDRF